MARIVIADAGPLIAFAGMDDRLARRYALRKGLHIVGSVRLLDLAEQSGLIESAERCIQEISDFGYRVSHDLLKWIMRFISSYPQRSFPYPQWRI